MTARPRLGWPTRPEGAWRLGTLMAASTLLAGLGACADGCARGGSADDPRLHLPADVEAVIELRDLSALPELNATIEKRFTEVIPAADMMAARAELERTLGFDPLSAEGLRQAGLPAKGRVAGGMTGRSSVWVFPVADRAKVQQTVERLVEARSTADKTKEKVNGIELTLFGRSFGDEVSQVAAFTVRGKLGFLGLGRDARERVVAAVGLKPEAAVTTDAQYRALDQELGDRWLVRGILPHGGQSLQTTLKRAGRKAQLNVDEEAMKGIRSAGWTLDFADAGLVAKGKLRLEGEALAQAKQIFATKAPATAGIKALSLPEAVIFAEVNGDPAELMQRLAPPGSRARRRLAQLLAELGMKSEAEVLGELTGQAALALGVGDLAEVQFKQLMGNPMSVAWTALALGVKSPEAFAQVTEDMTAKLAERGFEPKPIEVGKTKVTSVVRKDDPETVLVQSFARPGAVVYANEPVVTGAILANGAAEDPLGGKAGVVVEARLGQLGRQLRKFNVGDLPIMFRSMIVRGIDALTLLDRLSISVRPQDDGVSVDASLTLAPQLLAP